MLKTCYAIRHVAFEHLGLIEDVLKANSFGIKYLQAGVDDLTPAKDANIMIILGGPIGVYENDLYPFLDNEISLIKQRLQSGLPMLGICLGAQLIAAAAGAKVYPGPAREIGWGPIIPTQAGLNTPLRHLAQADWQVLHWHGDTFDLPDGAELLASTAQVKHQAFSLGKNVLALQFHPEPRAHEIETWLIGHSTELNMHKIDPRTLRTDTQRYGPATQQAGMQVFADWLKRLGLT